MGCGLGDGGLESGMGLDFRVRRLDLDCDGDEDEMDV
jgi:hypothetical protein